MQAYTAHYTPEDVTLLEASIQMQKQSIQAIGKQFCADVIWKASGHYNRVWLLTCVDQDIIEEVTRQHCDMIAAIKAGDTEKLLAIFNHHLSKIGNEERIITQIYPDLFL